MWKVFTLGYKFSSLLSSSFRNSLKISSAYSAAAGVACKSLFRLLTLARQCLWDILYIVHTNLLYIRRLYLGQFLFKQVNLLIKIVNISCQLCYSVFIFRRLLIVHKTWKSSWICMMFSKICYLTLFSMKFGLKLKKKSNLICISFHL